MTSWRSRAKAARYPDGVPSSLQSAILVASANSEFVGKVCAQLQNEGFRVVTAVTGADAVGKTHLLHPNLALLDVALPSMPGLEACLQIKSSITTAKTGVILFSSENQEFDRIAGFENGADDCAAASCSLRELVLRLKAVLGRRTGIHHRHRITVGSIIIDLSQRCVLVDQQLVQLTATEFRLLASLAKHVGVVIRREILLSEIGGNRTVIGTRSIDTYLQRLRTKLGKAARHLQTVRGFGYRLVP